MLSEERFVYQATPSVRGALFAIGMEASVRRPNLGRIIAIVRSFTSPTSSFGFREPQGDYD